LEQAQREIDKDIAQSKLSKLKVKTQALASSIEELKERISLESISNKKSLIKISDQMDLSKQENARVVAYKELVEKNINDTQFEVKKQEIARMDKMEEQTELIIELDALTTNIDKKERDIAKIRLELETIEEEEEKERLNGKEDEEIEIGTYGRDDCFTNYDDDYDNNDIENLVEKLSYIQVHESLL
jgi:hypothetical protein